MSTMSKTPEPLPPERSSASRDLRDHWESLRLRIEASPKICLLSDFDGTLVPLEARPDIPRLEGKVRRVLETLIGMDGVLAGIVSGRSLADLVPRIDLPRIWYVGNHGFEIRDPRGLERRLYEPKDVLYLSEVEKELRTALSGIPGVFLENKGPILAVHFREVPPAETSKVERAFISVMEQHRQNLMVTHGHAVMEARLRGNANKGRAVTQIRYELPAGTLVIYFGDDITDRDVFRELKGFGISVEIGGDDASIADFTLPDPKAVLGVLSKVATTMESRRSHKSPSNPSSRRSGP